MNIARAFATSNKLSKKSLAKVALTDLPSDLRGDAQSLQMLANKVRVCTRSACGAPCVGLLL